MASKNPYARTRKPSLSPLNNLQVACLYILEHGPQRAATLRKEMYRARFGKEMPDRGWYTSYFIEGGFCHSRYVLARSGSAALALWKRDPATMLWSLTARGERKAERAKEILDKHWATFGRATMPVATAVAEAPRKSQGDEVKKPASKVTERELVAYVREHMPQGSSVKVEYDCNEHDELNHDRGTVTVYLPGGQVFKPTMGGELDECIPNMLERLKKEAYIDRPSAYAKIAQCLSKLSDDGLQQLLHQVCGFGKYRLLTGK